MKEPKATRADYTGLAASIREHGWPQGLEFFAQRSFEQGYQISTDLWPRHAAWKGLFSWAHRGSALVVEAGCGTVALSLASDFDHVCVVPADPDVREGIRARVRAAGVGNVTVSETLPCTPGSYDAAAVCGLHTEYLERHLPEIVLSLRRHGSLYVIFDVPRTTSVHSLLYRPFHRIQKQLRGHFDRVDPYWYMGSMTQPCELRAIAERTGGFLAPYLGGTFALAASTREAGPSLFEEIVAATGAAVDVERRVFAHPAGFSLIVRDRATRRRSIIRIPSDDYSLERARRNFDHVNLLHKRHSVPVDIPVQVQKGEIRGQAFFMEHMLEGQNFSRADLTDEKLHTAVIQDATSRLIGLHQATAHPVDLTRTRTERLLGGILRHARTALSGDKGRDVLPEVEAYLFSTLEGRHLNLVFSHGDYTFDNLMFDRHGRVTGMFDWDLSQPDALPLLDLLYFLITAERGRTGGWVPSIFADRVRRGFRPVEQRLIDDYCHALAVPPDLVTPLFILTCLHHLGVRMHQPEPYAVFDSYWTEFLQAVPGVIRRSAAVRAL